MTLAAEGAQNGADRNPVMNSTKRINQNDKQGKKFCVYQRAIKATTFNIPVPKK